MQRLQKRKYQESFYARKKETFTGRCLDRLQSGRDEERIRKGTSGHGVGDRDHILPQEHSMPKRRQGPQGW